VLVCARACARARNLCTCVCVVREKTFWCVNSNHRLLDECVCARMRDSFTVVGW